MLDIEFEIHMTFSDLVCRNEEFSGQVQRACDDLKLKNTCIRTDDGILTDHMVTFWLDGTLDEVKAEATTKSWQLLTDYGLDVCRIKIETGPESSLVPTTLEQVQHEPDWRYFEYHIKLLLPDWNATTRAKLTQLTCAQSAKISNNARRVRDDGYHERFVNRRFKPGTLAESSLNLDHLVGVLRDHDYDIIEIEHEYVVEDNLQQRDSFWLPAITARRFR